MIRYKKGNIFDSDADCLFNTVNCEGYMGKGIAYQFKDRFPENNERYVECCNEGKLKPGILLPFFENGKTIINFPTKDKWREPSQMKYIIDGLDYFVELLQVLDIKKAAIPPLGCGNGGLNWDEVKKVIESKLGNCNIEIDLYEPAISINKVSDDYRMTVDDLLLLHVKEKLNRPTSLRFQKTVFFSNYYGKRDLYHFERGRFGPYSKWLYHETEKIGKYQKANGLSNAEETMLAIHQVICSKKVDEKYKKLSHITDQGIELINSIEDDTLLEGMATALYLIRNEGISEVSDICREFREWSEDKAARFSDETIIKSLDNLEMRGIIQKNIFERYELI